MFFVFFVLWVVFNGRVSLEVMLIGALISALLCWFSYRFLGYRPAKMLRALKRVPGVLAYGVTLLTEIVRANLQVTRILLGKRAEIKPQLVTFQTPLHSRTARTLLANSITLTPGTITVFATGDELTVHCLDQVFAEGLNDSDFQRRLSALEEGGKPS